MLCSALDDRDIFCLVETGNKGVRIRAVSTGAMSAGARVGQALNDARAICPQLESHAAEPQLDAQSLKSLAQWCDRYSPLVALMQPNGIIIDVTGCAHLFGGEAALMADVAVRLKRMGLSVCTGLADTVAAARAVAFYGSGKAAGRIIPVGEIPAAVNALPVEALFLCDDTIVLLKRLGLKTIGSVAAIPRPALARRFRSKQVMGDICLKLDHLYGKSTQVFEPLKPAPSYRSRIGYSEPVLDIVSIEHGLDYLLKDMAHQLERDGLGIRAITLSACRVDGSVRALTVRLSTAQREPAHIARLFKQRLEQIDPGEGVDSLVLGADSVQSLNPHQVNLDGTHTQKGEEIAALIDRLANRLGDTNIYRSQPRSSHIPERAQTAVVATAYPCWTQQTLERPFRLLLRPEVITAIAEVPDGPPLQFVWRRVHRQVVRARGPERIAPEWWLEGSAGEEVRDYYEVEDTQGHRYWLYRAGLYQDPVRKGPPLWFVHGLFA